MGRMSPNLSSHFLGGCFLSTQFTCSSVGIWTLLLKIPSPWVVQQMPKSPLFFSLLLVKSVFTMVWGICRLVYWFNVICKDVCRRLCRLRSLLGIFSTCYHLVFYIFRRWFLSPCSSPVLFLIAGDWFSQLIKKWGSLAGSSVFGPVLLC